MNLSVIGSIILHFQRIKRTKNIYFRVKNVTLVYRFVTSV